MEKIKVYNPYMKDYIGTYVIAEFGSYTLRGIVMMDTVSHTLYIEYCKNNSYTITKNCFSLTYYKHFGEGKPLQNYREPRPSRDTLARLQKRKRRPVSPG